MFSLCLKNTYDFIYIRELEINPAPRLCARLFKIPLYIEINELFLPFYEERGAAVEYINRVERHQRQDFKQASGLVVPSVTMCKWIKNYYKLSDEKVHMILNGYDPDKLHTSVLPDIKKKIGLSADAFCLGFLGNVHDRTDFNTILKAMSKAQHEIPGLHLVIIGEGPDLQRVKKRADKYGLQNKTTFTGYVFPDELCKIVPAIDVGLIIHTKICCERYGPFATKLAAYALFQLPVIAAGFSMVDYPREIRQSLYLVPPEDPKLLSELIIRIYRDTSERSRKANDLHAYATRCLTWNAVANSILKIYEMDKLSNMHSHSGTKFQTPGT
jgi:1,4-alpha-glucan branching enzyme